MFAIVTDSSAYLTHAEALRWGVKVLPMLYSAGSMPLGEGYIDESGNFRELIQKNPRDLHTSQVPMSAFMGAFNELLRKGKPILCITMSSRLSGTYSNAVIAARELGGENIIVVDSLSTAAGMRFLVRRASELSEQGASIHQAADELEAMREQIGISLSVDDMEALRRSGRLGFVRQSVGTILNIRPILHVKDGAVVAGRQTRGLSGQVHGLVDTIPKNVRHIEVNSITDKPAVDMLEAEVRRKFPNATVHRSLVGPVLAIHLGLSAIGVAWIQEEES